MIPGQPDPRRDPEYRLHRMIGICGYLICCLVAAAALVLALIKLMAAAAEVQHQAFVSVAGFALTASFAFLSYVRQVQRCYDCCKSLTGFSDCMKKVTIIALPQADPPNPGGTQ